MPAVEVAVTVVPLTVQIVVVVEVKVTTSPEEAAPVKAPEAAFAKEVGAVKVVIVWAVFAAIVIVWVLVAEA